MSNEFDMMNGMNSMNPNENAPAAPQTYHSPYDRTEAAPAAEAQPAVQAAAADPAPAGQAPVIEVQPVPAAAPAAAPAPKPSYSAPSPYATQPYSPADFKPKEKKSGKRWALSIAAICSAMVIAGGSFYAGAVYTTDHVGQNAAASVSSTTASSPVVANGTTVNISQDETEISSTITDVVEQAMPSMVAINTITETSIGSSYAPFYYYMFGDDYNQTYETSASGSGIIIGQNDTELLIVTNNHVIDGADTIAVQFIDDETYDAVIKGTSADNDLAVIAVKLSDISSDTLSKIKVATLGNSENLKLGEPAIAIGNSLGYGQSVTVGYISATGREVQISDRTMTLIQTDAAINPGNSGGALLNIKGEVIGINSAKYSDTSVEGTGYAIPISDAEPIINDLISSNYVSDDEKPYLGIYGQDVPASYQERFDWPAGVYVSQVTRSSPAQLAGVQAGDIITAVNGEEISTMEELQKVLEKCKVGDKITLTVTRTSNNGKLQQSELTATLIARGDAETE